MGNYYAGMINNAGGYGELKHHGILGQKWGIRRFQFIDGSLTAEGKKRYRKSKTTKERYVFRDRLNKAYDDSANRASFNEFLNSNSESSRRMINAADTYSKASSKLIFEFDKYRNRLAKETGKEWDGDGTELHWKLEEKYPEYLKVSKQFEKAEKHFAEVINKEAESGVLDNVLNATDYVDTVTSADRKHLVEHKINGKAVLASQYIADKYRGTSGKIVPDSSLFEKTEYKDRKTIIDRISNFYNGRTNGETDSTKVKDSTLRRQMDNNIRSNTRLQDNWDFRGKSAREERDLSRNFVKTSVKEFNSSKKDQKSWQKAKADAEKYMRNVAEIRLKSMGYEVTDKAINNLVSKDWFKNSLWIQNTLASMGANGVKHTSKDDMLFR